MGYKVVLEKMKNNIFIKSIIVIIILLLLYVTIIASANKTVKNVGSKFGLFCAQQSQFQLNVPENKEVKSNNINKKSNFTINEDNTIHYLYENFDNYGDIQSLSLENFENLDYLSLNMEKTKPILTKETINGDYSLLLKINQDNYNSIPTSIIVDKKFSTPIDLSRWSKSGFLSLWMRIDNRDGIHAIQIKLIDINGSIRIYDKIENLQLDIPNYFNEDDPFQDIEYPAQKTSSDEWTDFLLAKGWNYVLWRMDNNYFQDINSVDTSKIKSLEIIVDIDKNIKEQNIILDDVRVQDGIQKENNALNGFWYPPLGRPQYGIYDIDKKSNNDYTLKLLNVRQSQYPSNGDHGRLISNYDTPLNFAMRVKFKLDDLSSINNKENTWFRLMYDFDPDFDPGHDWFGVYLSMEWDKFGLITVIPIERFFIQDKEPKEVESTTAVRSFKANDKTDYEIDLVVHGQEAKATIYEIKDNCYNKKKEVTYKFLRPRYDANKRYPIALEITGDVKTVIYEIELLELR